MPSISRLLREDRLVSLASDVPSTDIASAARIVIDDFRNAILGGTIEAPELPDILDQVVQTALLLGQPSLHAAINATGVVLHTGLGRARLAPSAVRAIGEAASNHSSLEIDLQTGKRGSRQDHVRDLLCGLTGAEEAGVVNNCAAAVLLAITALAAGKEVILSRGELVEIGGAFRMPDIIRAGGAKLVEVGTTNRTRISDYRDAITDETALILRCHPSNFAIIGFTEEASSSELVALGRTHGIPVMEDQGSGALIDLSAMGLSTRHGSLPASVSAGFDLITASGDKLMGATQAGLVIGNTATVKRLMSHPMARSLRIDKLSLAGLEATLRLYRMGGESRLEIPTLRYLSRNRAELAKLASRLVRGLRSVLSPEDFVVESIPSSSQVGGGSVPGDELPTVCASIRPIAETPETTVDWLAGRFRQASRPVFGRIHRGALLLDPRTLEASEITEIVQAAKSLFERR